MPSPSTKNFVVNAESAAFVAEQMDPDGLYAILDREYQPFKKTTQPKLKHKPLGQWYALGNEWLEWCLREDPGWIGTHIYRLEIDRSKLLVISTMQELRDFNERFGFNDYSAKYLGYRDDLKNCVICWDLVSQTYSGIEIQNYREIYWSDTRACRVGGSDNFGLLWFYGWDVDSGVIWDPSAIQSVTLEFVYDPANNKFENRQKLTSNSQKGADNAKS